jgi:hypothetical protein
MNGARNFSKLDNLKMDSDLSTINTKQSKHAENTEVSQ